MIGFAFGRGEALREKLVVNGLPWDAEAERCLIGAVMVAPDKYARRFAKRVGVQNFYLPQHAWLWGRLATLDVAGVVEYRRKFCGLLAPLVKECLEAGMWWHGDYYCDRVLKAFAVRLRIERAADELAKAIELGRVLSEQTK